MKRQQKIAAAVLAVGVIVSSAVFAAPITVMVGDNDGYGYGSATIPDNGAAPWTNPPVDNRSAAEAAATDGAQITDVYSAIFPGAGPNGSATASVIFPFAGTLAAGSLTIDMGDFQSTVFGPIAADVNGVALSLAFDDGYKATAVRSFTLTAAMLSAANAAGQVVLNLDRDGSNDFIAFDYFELNGRTVPEPGTLALLGLGLAGLAASRRRKQ